VGRGHGRAASATEIHARWLLFVCRATPGGRKDTRYSNDRGIESIGCGDGKKKRTLEIEGETPRFDRDAELLLTVAKPGAKLWDAHTGREIATLNSGDAKLSPDGRTIAAYDHGAGIIKLYDVETLIGAAGSSQIATEPLRPTEESE